MNKTKNTDLSDIFAQEDVLKSEKKKLEKKYQQKLAKDKAKFQEEISKLKKDIGEIEVKLNRTKLDTKTNISHSSDDIKLDAKQSKVVNTLVNEIVSSIQAKIK